MSKKIINYDYPVTGNTYPVHDKLKALGCKWDQGDKCWLAQSEEMHVEACLIVGAGPAKPYTPRKGTYADRSVARDQRNIARDYGRRLTPADGADYYSSGQYDLDS